MAQELWLSKCLQKSVGVILKRLPFLEMRYFLEMRDLATLKTGFEVTVNPKSSF